VGALAVRAAPEPPDRTTSQSRPFLVRSPLVGCIVKERPECRDTQLGRIWGRCYVRMHENTPRGSPARRGRVARRRVPCASRVRFARQDPRRGARQHPRGNRSLPRSWRRTEGRAGRRYGRSLGHSWPHRRSSQPRQCIAALSRLGNAKTRQGGSHVRLKCPGRSPLTVPLHDELD